MELGLLGLVCAGAGTLVGCGGRSDNEHVAAGAGSAGIVGSSGGASSASGGASSIAGAAALDCQDLSGAMGPGSFELVFDSPATSIRYLVARDDGTLVGLRNRELVVITADGAVTTGSLEPFDRAFDGEWSDWRLSPRGNAVLATQSSRTAILDFRTGEVAVFEPPVESEERLNLAFSDSGNFVMALFGELYPERQYEHSLEVRRLNGEIVTTQPPRERMPFIPATDDTLVWPEDKELVVTDLAGTESFRFAPVGRVNGAFASADGRSVLVESGTSVTLLNPSLNWVRPPVELGEAPMYRALSSSGTYIALILNRTPGIQQLYDGSIERPLLTGIVKYSSLAVNSDGVIIAGGAARDERSLIELLTWQGGLLLSCFGQSDMYQAPAVGFIGGGRRAYALFKDRLLVFNVTKR